MVVGTKAKNKKNTCVQLDCVINVVEIKPWPPSKSLISLRSALIQWEHGDKNSGSTKPVAPSYVSGFGVGDGKIEFNESFRLHVTLSKEDETFVKNCIEFNLYEPRRDKTVKGQLLATAVVDLAEYGIVHESLMISVPMSCKRSFGSTTQPMLFVKIHMVERNNRMRSSSSRESLISQGSVSVLMNEEYTEEAETDSSMDDDDISSQSSMTTGSVTFGSNGNRYPQRQNGSEAICGSAGKVNDQEFSVKNKRAAYEERISSSKDLYSDLENARTTFSSIRNSRFSTLSQIANSQNVKPSRSTNDGTNAQSCKLFQLFDASQSGQESQIIGDLGFDADRLKNVKSFGSLLDSGICNGYLRTSKILEKLKDVGVNENKDVSKLQHLEQRVQNLEDELREAAAIEVSLYSVVAEHGSSINRVHAPARRLSRLYLHACKENSSRRTTSARSIVSGFVSVTKACGNDVPRLTFWLSNSIVLRAIIHKSFEKGNNENISLNESRSSLHNDWEDPCMVTSVLEKVESWIFTRIIESIWWQTLAPYMQTTAGKEIIRVVDSESNTSCQATRDHEEVNTSLELWKTAFMDACERICPVRAAGRNCGCLSVLSMLIMEQCMSRLDVAMLNAILREPEDEGPTDPVSDPIGDARVLPIPSGKASFGAGAQLKKTIGNWSTWLTDLFGSPITFHLLTSLSELMMMPKDMLLSSTIRKEVCPTFGIPLIKRILDSFLPDEFCPDVIPEVVLEALASEDLIESSKDSITSLPCVAAPIIYHPPSASLIGCILGDDGSQAKLSRSGSSILRKSNTSDDELDELDSPLTSIIDSYPTVAASKKPVWTVKDTNIIRYQLLKEMWMNSD